MVKGMKQSTPTQSTPTPEQIAETKTRSLLPSFPTVEQPTVDTVIKYGEQPAYVFPIDNKGGIGRIDRALLSGKGTKRLLNIKKALKVAGKENTPENRAWFNREVRDVWHKVLRFAAKDSLANGKPVSLGLSLRRTKRGGEILTSRHGFEQVVKADDAKAVADKAVKAEKAPKAPKAPKSIKAPKAPRIKPELKNPVIPPTVNVDTTVKPVNGNGEAVAA